MPLLVVGGSAGAIAPLREIVGGLGAAFPAAVLVVIHMPGGSASGLARILGRIGGMDATFAEHGAPIEPGIVYVAPPGSHLLVHGGHLVLSQAAPENGTRPAIDPLFRTAARSRGPGVVSVLLSGTLDDGSAGTVAVRRAGGLTIAQDPGDAEFGDMPGNAIATGMVSVVMPAAGIAERVRAAAQQLAQTADFGPRVSADARPAGGARHHRERPVRHLFRRRHRASAGPLAHDRASVVGDALWTAMQSLDESASLAGRVRDRAAERGDRRMEQRFEARREGAQARADRMRALLHSTDPDEVTRAG